MLFVVWFLPLFLSWCMERHLKSKYMAACASGAHQQQQQQGLDGSAAAAAAGVTVGAEGRHQYLQQGVQAPSSPQQCKQRSSWGPGTEEQPCGTAESTTRSTSGTEGSSSGWDGCGIVSGAYGIGRVNLKLFHTSIEELPLFPPGRQLFRVVGLALGFSVVVGELFVALCVQFPVVGSMLRKQVLV
jgi:hypothetical protein